MGVEECVFRSVIRAVLLRYGHDELPHEHQPGVPDVGRQLARGLHATTSM